MPRDQPTSSAEAMRKIGAGERLFVEHQHARSHFRAAELVQE